MNFAEPRLLALLALAPLAALGAVWIARRRAGAEAAWVARGLSARLRAGGPPRPVALVAVLLALALAATALALARPRWGESSEKVERKGVDIVFVLDTSASMAAGDVPPSRIWLAQSLVRRIAQQLPGNRVALVQAEGTGVVMAPLTVDVAVLDLLLDAVEPGSLPLPGTQLAPAVQRALTLFPEGGDKHRVIVLVSDGEDHGEGISTAAEALRASGAVLHAIGVGTSHGAPVPVPGRPGEFKRDRDGQVVVSRLHPETLRALVEATGGVYLEAERADADPQAIVARISRMEGRSLDAAEVNTLEERFQWPLALAVLAALALLALSPYARRPAEEPS
jgi:Ca-activated chloride channel family protein